MKRHSFRRLTRATSFLALASLFAAGACSDGETPAEPVIPEAPEPVPGIRAASFVADVNLNDRTIDITSPEDGLNFNAIADYFGLEPGHPELSILGGDVVEVLPLTSTISFGAPNAASLKRRVSFELQIRNRLQGVALIGSTNLPVPPTGVTSPVLFPFENLTTVTSGGVSGSGNEVIVELPSQGEVVASDSIWDGPPHNFFNDEGCNSADNDCFVYKPIVEEGTARDTIGGLASSDPVRLGWDVDLTVNQFRSRLILAADLIDAVPNVLPTASFGPAPAPGLCLIGTPISLDGSSSSDSDGFIASYAWDFGNDGSVDATGASTSFSPPASPGSVDVALTVTDNRGGQDTIVQTYDCQFPPANAFVTKELVNTAGAPVSGVEEGAVYRYVITFTNQSPVTPLTGFTVTDVLDADIASASVISGVGTISAGTYSYGPVTLSAGASETVTIEFTVANGTAGGTLDNTVIIDSPDDTNAADDQASVTGIPITTPPNVIGRWLDNSGTPITTASVGQTVYLQICTTEETLEGFDASLSTTSGADITGAQDLESDGGPPAPLAGAVHPDCVGTDDQLDDFFTPNITSPQSVTFGVGAITAPSVGRVGITEVTIDVTSAGTYTPVLTITNFDIGGGTQGTVVQNIQSLIVS